MWDGDVAGWTWVRRDTLSIQVCDTTLLVILRLPDVSLCVGLPEAIERQEFARVGRDTTKWELVDLRNTPRTARAGDDFMVFAWGHVRRHACECHFEC